MKIAVVGATGLVGSKMLAILEERNFPVSELIPVASRRSVGKSIDFKGKEYKVLSYEEALSKKPQIALFSAGSNTSLELAPLFEAVGCRVIDNSSAWRMDASKKLIVPEINADALSEADFVIANPNCSTIQMMMVLYPLHVNYGVKRVVVSTYQSVTGSGAKAVAQLEGERKGEKVDPAYPYPIDKNLIPHIDVFQKNGYTKEEMKMITETKKIMDDDVIRVTATAVRVPVVGGHSESLNVELAKPTCVDALRALLHASPGIEVQDDVADLIYPMPLYTQNSDAVFVGRIRQDDTRPNAFNLWVVSDNLRKGAATNAIQIAEHILSKQWC